MKIQFPASLPDIMSALNIGGDGCCRVKIDIPEMYLSEAVKMVMLKGKVFTVTIEVDEDDGR